MRVPIIKANESITFVIFFGYVLIKREIEIEDERWILI
jgi:hypothetical protein